MKTIKIENVTLEIDEKRTEKFYKTQNTFVCDCSDCLNYLSKIPDVLDSLNGIDKKLGIDLNKAVGQGMDELMPHDFEEYHLYVVPYYVIGKCYLNGIELEKEFSGPIWKNTKRVEKKLCENLSITIINTTDSIKIEDAENILTIWLEYKTELIKK